MKYLSTKRVIIMMRILLAAFLGLLILLTPTSLALAEPDPAEQTQQQIQTIEGQANAVRGELANLNLALEKVVEHHNTTRFQLDQLTMQLADSRHLLANASAQYGAQLPHASSIQFRMGTPVPPDQLQPGDLVFFYGATAPQHVGMYIGKGKYVDCLLYTS